MEGKEMYSSYRWLILLVGCFSVTCYSINMIVYAPLFGEIAKDLRIDMSASLNLSMAFLIVVALSVGFGGIFVDRYGLTKIYVGGMLFGSVPALLMPWIGHSYGIVFASRLIQGPIAISAATVGPILALWFPQREQGLAGGLLMCCISAGTAIGLVASPAVFKAVGTWQKTVALSSIPGWITMGLALLITRRLPPPEMVKALTEAAKSGPEGATYLKLLAEPLTWLGLFMFSCNAWGLYTLYTVVPSYLASPPPMGIGLGPIAAGRLSLLLAAMGIPAFILGGLFFDKVAKGKSSPAIFIGFLASGILTYCLLLPVVYQNVVLLSIALMIAGFGLPFMAPSVSAFVATNYPPHLVGSMIGLWFGIGTLGGALGIYLAGVATAMTGNFDWSIRFISLAAGAGFLLGFTLRPRVGRKIGLISS